MFYPDMILAIQKMFFYPTFIFCLRQIFLAVKLIIYGFIIFYF